MRLRFIGILLLLTGSVSLRADLKPSDSDERLFRIIAIGEGHTLTVSSIHSFTVQPDGKGIAIVLTEQDRKSVADILHRFPRNVLC